MGECLVCGRDYNNMIKNVGLTYMYEPLHLQSVVDFPCAQLRVMWVD